jgi:hypothetical protein
MNTNGLAKLYDCLSPRERLPLIVAAVDRGDAAEADRLAHSAPMRVHRLPDYHGLAEGLLLLSLFHLLTLQERAARFWNTLAVLEDSVIARRGAAPTGDRDQRLHSVARLWAYLYTVEAEAWKRLAAELNLDPETLLRDLPGYGTLRDTEEVIRLMAFTEEEATAYLRQRGGTEVRPVTVEKVLADLWAVLHSRVAWWQ